MKLPRLPKRIRLHKKVIILGAAVFVLVGGTTVFAIQADTSEQNVAPERGTGDTTTMTQEDTKPAEAEQTQTVEQPQPAPQQQQTTQQPAAPTNPFEETGRGHNAWYVFNRRAEVGKSMPMPSAPTSHVNYCSNLFGESPGIFMDAPSQYAIACNTNARGHHVAFVEEVNADGSIWITEMNSRGQTSKTDSTPAGGFGKVNWKLVPAVEISRFKYIP